NPHMHLLEAMLALYAFTRDARWAERAQSLGRLFAERLYDPKTGTLAEVFDGAWRRLTPVIVEPGHHFEWVWLLERLNGPVAQDRGEAAARLYDFAARHGVDAKTGLVWDEVNDAGEVAKPTRRLWPQTERLKALLARAERGAVDTGAIAQTLDVILDSYLEP